MAWAWVEKNQIYVAYIKDVVPQNIEVLEVDDTVTPQDLVIDNGKLRLKTEAEKLQELKQEKLAQLKQYVANLLSQTDWVIVKLQSMREEGWADTEIQADVQKYQFILEQRRKIREWNKQIKQAIQNAQTIEELEVIQIDFS